MTYKVDGTTKDTDDNPLGSCTVWLFRTDTKAYVAETTSNAATGAYSFTGLAYGGPYFLRAHKDGVVNVFGTTDDDVMGVEE